MKCIICKKEKDENTHRIQDGIYTHNSIYLGICYYCGFNTPDNIPYKQKEKLLLRKVENEKLQ